MADSPLRTLDDLERTVRALAMEFKADKVFIVGSQSILLAWPQAPTIMRSSPEIDAYPANARLWEVAARKIDPEAEASEHINGLFGYGSTFHRTHGFYIDGVDETTAKLPPGWERRAINRPVEVGDHVILAVAPCPEDLIVSKLARLDSKDKVFIEAYHRQRPLDTKLIEKRVVESKFSEANRQAAIAYINSLGTA